MDGETRDFPTQSENFPTHSHPNFSMWIHIPTPGDHYSPAYGSARVTVTYETSCQHAANGKTSRIVVGEGTRHDHNVGEVVEVPFRGPVSRAQKAVDVLLGRLGRPRFFGPRRYAPALNAIPLGFDGPVFVHNNPVAVPMLAKARPHAKICLWAANELFNTYSRRETEAVVSAAHRIICVSGYIADDLREKIGRDEPKIRVVGNGINVERFSPDDSKRTLPPLVLYVGRVVREKGPDVLLQAAQLLKSRGVEFRVKIVGSNHFNPNDQLSEYENLLRELALPLGETAIFQPAVNREQVVEEYRAASVFCSPIRWKEPFGLTLLEAMASGLPVVTAPLGGAKQACGEAGIYFEAENAIDLADKLEELLRDEAKRERQGEICLQHAHDNSWASQYKLLRAALA